MGGERERWGRGGGPAQKEKEEVSHHDQLCFSMPLTLVFFFLLLLLLLFLLLLSLLRLW